MKKYISVALTALLTLVLFSCKKESDVSGTEAKLPAIQLSSLGYNQIGPFPIANSASGVTPVTTATTLQLLFGATTTNITPGRFTLEFIEGTSVTATSVVVKTVNFNSWKGYDDTSLPDRKPTPLINHTISYTLQPTTYTNTQVYGGSIQVKLGLLGLSANKTYSVRATAYSADGTKTSVLSQTSFFKTI
jgi:hypothetical protein